MLSVLFLLLSWQLSESKTIDYGYPTAFYRPLLHTQFDIQPFQSENVTSIAACTVLCNSLDHCRSVNMYPISDDLYDCQLLPLRSFVSPHKLIAYDNSTFLEPIHDFFCGSCDRVINDGGEICDCRGCVEEATSCTEVMNNGYHNTGVYTINDGFLKFDAFCEIGDDEAWLVFQRRFNGKLEFWDKTWDQYRDGFGDIREEFWMGNEYLHTLTTNYSLRMQVDVTDIEENNKTYDYAIFNIGSEAENFKLNHKKDPSVRKDGFRIAEGKSFPFSTIDKDNSFKNNQGQKCTQRFKGAWWYNNKGAHCHDSNLNGQYYPSGKTVSEGVGMEWSDRKISMKKTMMKLRF